MTTAEHRTAKRQRIRSTRRQERSSRRAAPVDAARERGGRDRPLAETPPALVVRIDRLLDQAAAAHAESSGLERRLAFVPALLRAN